MPTPQVEFSTHTQDMLNERRILAEWVWRTLEHPDTKRWNVEDGNMHYTKTIWERQGQVLHVVVNPNVQPNRVVTVFFDRRLGRKP